MSLWDIISKYYFRFLRNERDTSPQKEKKVGARAKGLTNRWETDYTKAFNRRVWDRRITSKTIVVTNAYKETTNQLQICSGSVFFSPFLGGCSTKEDYEPLIMLKYSHRGKKGNPV